MIHEATPELEATLREYAGAIEEVMSRTVIEGEIIEQPCLPPGDAPEDDTGESVHTAEADPETG